MARIAGIVIAVGLLIALALFCALQFLVYAVSGYGAWSFLWLGGSALAILGAVAVVVASGPDSGGAAEGEDVAEGEMVDR